MPTCGKNALFCSTGGNNDKFWINRPEKCSAAGCPAAVVRSKQYISLHVNMLSNKKSLGFFFNIPGKEEAFL